MTSISTRAEIVINNLGLQGTTQHITVLTIYYYVKIRFTHYPSAEYVLARTKRNANAMPKLFDIIFTLRTEQVEYMIDFVRPKKAS